MIGHTHPEYSMTFKAEHNAPLHGASQPMVGVGATVGPDASYIDSI